VLEQQDSKRAMVAKNIKMENQAWKLRRDTLQETLLLGSQWMVSELMLYILCISWTP